ncbi:MAG TPA: hypothetical protein VF794_05370 [Archangium sp.]|uniref:hypothetical protein n=1 Tax=Archangium sp. TaxID=1872627 RepID=UPI002ED9DC5C
MRLWNLGACLLALLMVSCGGETGTTVDEQAVGTVELPLTSPGPEGKMYRLVGATFEIAGPQNVTLTDTSADTVQTNLMAGAYTVKLNGSWSLQDLAAPGTSIPAQLLSPNPLPFYVTKGQTSEVRFLFKLPGQGSANVGFRVDGGGWLAGTLNFTELYSTGYPPSSFDELVGKSVPFVISFESSTVMRDNSWAKQLTIQSSPVTVQFGGAPSEALERAASSMKGGTLFLTLRTSMSGPNMLEFSGMQFQGPPDSFRFELMGPNGAFPGSVDAEGYPALRPFKFDAFAILRDGNGGQGVTGPASVNGSP